MSHDMTYKELVANALKTIPEVMPWDLINEFSSKTPPLLVDVRERKEFNAMQIKNSIHTPRGLLESACEWGYDDTVPILASNRKQNIVLICRSGKRSALAGITMQQLGFKYIRSLALGIKGWNDADLELIDSNNNIVNADDADKLLNKRPSKEKLRPIK